MIKLLKQKKNIEDKLYNKILLLSRNKLFYTKMCLKDTFQNRIHLIFLHTSFLFNKINHNNKNTFYKEFYQKIFDFIFKQIEINMREIGYGDVTVNKNMKFLIKNFYNILLDCEKFKKKTVDEKNKFLTKYLAQNKDNSSIYRNDLVEYFVKYQSFCFYLTIDSVLKGNLNFIYK